MSEWDELDPEQKRRRMLNDPVQAARLIAADRALIAAMKCNPVDLSALTAALKNDACPDRVVINGMPALHVAIHKRDIKALDLLLRHAARTDDWDVEGATVMDEAYRKRFHEGIKLLKLFNAETRVYRAPGEDAPEEVYAPSYEMRMNSLLLNMIRRGTPAQVQLALDLGANVHVRQEGLSFTPPLHAAIAQCEPDKVKLLLDAGADVFARAGRGEDAVDMLWQAPAEKLLSAEWYAIFDRLYQHGYNNLFVRDPKQFTLDDLRQPLPNGDRDAPTLLQHLVHSGHAAVVFDILKKNPQDHLTAADFARENKKLRKTLLETCAEKGLLQNIFTVDIWQGRLEEMLSLRPLVENSYLMRNKVDFNKAAADVRARRLQDLKVKAPKLQLKKM